MGFYQPGCMCVFNFCLENKWKYTQNAIINNYMHVYLKKNIKNKSVETYLANKGWNFPNALNEKVMVVIWFFVLLPTSST